MIRNFLFSIQIFLLALTACGQTSKSAKAIVEPIKITESTMSFLTYLQNQVKFSEDFAALDTSSAPISKEAFLQRLSSGRYLPVRLASKDSSAPYELYTLDKTANSDIRMAMQEFGKFAYDHYKMEGTALPHFNFVDLKGNAFTDQNTKGKIVVVKCWFISCSPCVREIPALNELEKKYAGRDDIVFISLAFDPKEDLKDFLAKTPFSYAVVPDQQKYLEEDLKIEAYPTHIIINKQGFITKVVNDEKELAVALSKEASK